MNKPRDCKMVPGDGATCMTPPSKSQLKMASGQPEYRICKLYDPKKNRNRPVVICFPHDVEGASYCVVHTPEDYDRHMKCQTQRRFENHFEPRIKPWDEPEDVTKAVENARNGVYDAVANAIGFSDSLSYVMWLAEALHVRLDRAKEGYDHHLSKNRPMVGEECYE